MAISAAISVSAQNASANVSDQDILNDQNITSQVVTNGMGLNGQRFSPLSKINKDNVKKLLPVWSFSFGGEKQRGQEAQPLIYDGVMYVTASYSRVFAVDIKTGEELWQYDARLPDGIMPCCDVINRGAAIYGDLIYFGTLDAQLVALDRKTGKVTWKKKIGDYKAGYSITAAPMIVEGRSSRAYPVVNSVLSVKLKRVIQKTVNSFGHAPRSKGTWACSMAKRAA